MVLPAYLPYFFYVPFLVNSTCKVLFKKKIPCPFSVLDKTLINRTPVYSKYTIKVGSYEVQFRQDSLYKDIHVHV
jgi:hypothetical protein